MATFQNGNNARLKWWGNRFTRAIIMSLKQNKKI